MNIAIIPARGGSKRIPRKNIKLFDGKPMIAYAIGAAKSSGLFEHIVVSTDDEEIASIAREWGAETPFVRSAELANDEAATAPVVAHGVQACKALGWAFARVCCIYPGVPLLQVDDLRGALAVLEKDQADYCFPVAEFPAPIQRALRRMSDGTMQPFEAQYETTKTQALESAYYDAGQFYWGGAQAWLNNSRIHSSGIGYVIPAWRAVDIDTHDDWARAEAVYQTHYKSGIKTLPDAG
jgi:pseudaminic acid cytidylyltransferase